MNELKKIVVDDCEFTYSDKTIYELCITHRSDIGVVTHDKIYEYNIILESEDRYYYLESLFNDYEEEISLCGIRKDDITTTEDDLDEIEHKMHLSYISIELFFLDYDLAKKYYNFIHPNIEAMYIKSQLTSTEALIKTREEELEQLKKSYEELKSRRVD